MARKKKETPEGSWLDTYADLVTLLLTFFVLLFAFSSLDSEKFKLFQSSFGNTNKTVLFSPLKEEDIINVVSTSDAENEFASNQPSLVNESELENIQGKLEATAEYQESVKSFNALYQNMGVLISKDGLQDMLSVTKLGDTIVVNIKDALLFESGKADYLPESVQVIEKLGQMMLSSISNIEVVNIEGHTDNVPISNARFQDNWDLAAKRATNAVRILNENVAIPLDKLNAVVYGEFKPVASNDTPEGRAQNRRVCFVIKQRNVIQDMLNSAGNSQERKAAQVAEDAVVAAEAERLQTTAAGQDGLVLE